MAGMSLYSPSTNVVIRGGRRHPDRHCEKLQGRNAGHRQAGLPHRRAAGGRHFQSDYFHGEFVPDENGQISSNGLYFTDKDGKITINGVVGTLVVTETATIPGYTIDEATRTQTVVVNPNDTQTLHCTNTPAPPWSFEKYIEGTTTPLKGVTFLVT